MRYILILAGVMMIATTVAAPAAAQFQGPGAEETATSVQAILDNPVDDQKVQLRGQIVEKVGDEEYIFTDGEARIRIEVDDDEFPQQITPDMTVEIYGEVEDDVRQDPEIDVERITVVQSRQ